LNQAYQKETGTVKYSITGIAGRLDFAQNRQGELRNVGTITTYEIMGNAQAISRPLV
jgi:hypothetical protein